MIDIQKRQAILDVINLIQSPLRKKKVDGSVNFALPCYDGDFLSEMDNLDSHKNEIEEVPNDSVSIIPFLGFNLKQSEEQFNDNKHFKMKEENYFSWSNIDEMADVNSHIVYASTLMDKYQWEAKTRKILDLQLRRIVDKQNDKLLNICVIGEFSTGKSSFINALVGFELLAVNSLQGTTVAITIIEYGKLFGITITDFKGQISRKEYPNIEALSNELYAYTTDAKYAEKVCYLSVTLPAGILKNGFRIIDTPGTNSLELWHEEITRRAITELSDLSIVLIDATKPMPETLSSFVEDALGKSIKDCVFVANKIDLIREKERLGIVKYIGVKVGHNFDIESPFILPFSSVVLTNMFSKDKYPVDNDCLLLTTDSLKDLLAYTARNRIKAQARKILQLIEQIYTTLNRDIHLIAEKYERELRVLDRSKQTDLKPFIRRQISARQKSFVDEAKSKMHIAENKIGSLVKSSIGVINKQLNSCSTIDNLSDYIKNGKLSEDIEKEGHNLTHSIETNFDDVEAVFRSEIQKFQAEFRMEFSRLQMLSFQIEVIPQKIDICRTTHTANIGPVTTLISEELSKENWAFGGGAAAGAVLGTMLMPGIGTIMGAALGAVMAGISAAPDVAEVRTKVESKLSIPLSSYYRSVANDCMSNYSSYISDLNRNLDNEINRYYTAYNTTIQRRITEWKERHSSINIKIHKIQSEIDNIQSRQHSIHNIISRI